MRAVVGLLHKVVRDNLKEGKYIDTGIVKIDSSIERDPHIITTGSTYHSLVRMIKMFGRQP